MAKIGGNGCDHIFVEGQYDCDKHLVLEVLMTLLRKEWQWNAGEITMSEFDDCVKYFDAIDHQWTYVLMVSTWIMLTILDQGQKGLSGSLLLGGKWLNTNTEEGQVTIRHLDQIFGY